jgi:hypothetical protein
VAQCDGLRLGDDELHERGGVEVDRRGLPFPGPGSGQGGARAGPPGHGRQRGAQIEQVARRPGESAAAHEAADVIIAMDGNEKGHGTTACGDLDRAPSLDEMEVLACVLSQLPYTDGLHGATL